MLIKILAQSKVWETFNRLVHRKSNKALSQIRFCKKFLGDSFFRNAVDKDIHEERKNQSTTKFAAKGRICDSANKRKRIVFGIGSNIGDRNFYLEKAVLEITQRMLLTNSKTSKVLKNPALLLPDSPKEWDIEFFNIAFSADINLKKFPPQKILEIIKKVENHLGRKDRGKWSPREIDIDILLIEDLRVDLGDKLQIPHRELFNRDFFVKTVEEIEPELLKKFCAKQVV